MGSFDIRRNFLRKTTGLSEKDLATELPHRLRAIVRVSVSGYVPDDVEVRSRIDEKMFTAEFDQRLLDALENDTNVDSIAISEKLSINE